MKLEKKYISTRNACKLCTPLGACTAFKGIKGCIPLVHGSQGCSTYIRRYMISHYKEPVDIASTNFSEEAAIFGGEKNFFTAITNIIQQYKPEIIGIASTCLSETIGDDMEKLTRSYIKSSNSKDLPDMVHVSTASYRGTHADGFHHANREMVKAFAVKGNSTSDINIFPGFVSPEDLRTLKEIFEAFDTGYHMVPDYSETLDNPTWGEYKRMPEGGISRGELEQTGCALASIEFGRILEQVTYQSGAGYLENALAIPKISLGLPVGIKETDKFFEMLETLTGKKTPEKYQKQRGRLVDAYIDGHKYVFGKKAVVYGEEDFVVALVSFLNEIGIHTVLCASGGKSRLLKKVIKEDLQIEDDTIVMDGADFEEIGERCRELKPDILIGNSKGYYIARELNIPLVRVGFPIHDRVGGQRISHLGYSGTLSLFDKITNVLIEYKQDHSPVGYKYM